MFRLNIISALNNVYASLTHTHGADDVKDSSQHSNIGSSANDSQATINNKIDTFLGTHKHVAGDVKDSSQHSNIGSSANDSQATINTKIDTALSNKVAKVTNKGLSANDFTNTYKNQLDAMSVIADISSSASGAYKIGDIKLDGSNTVSLYGKDTNTVYTHPSHTARTGKPTADLTPAFGDSVTISQIVSDSSGHVTNATDRSITIPSTNASITVYGITKLSSATTSTSEVLAATPKAVKTAYDLANGKLGTATYSNGVLTIS